MAFINGMQIPFVLKKEIEMAGWEYAEGTFETTADDITTTGRIEIGFRGDIAILWADELDNADDDDVSTIFSLRQNHGVVVFYDGTAFESSSYFRAGATYFTFTTPSGTYFIPNATYKWVVIKKGATP